MKPLLRLVVVCLFLLALVGGGTFFYNPIWVNDQLIHWHLRGEHVRSEYVLVDGYRIHFYEAVPPQLPGPIHPPQTPLVLIHGLGARAEDWSGLIPGLAAGGFHVYALDLLGYGRSPQPTDSDYSISSEERIVLDFMRAVHLDRADVAGWSMGGWIALKLTADHPDRVDRLVLMDAAGVYFPPVPASLFTPSDPAGVTRLLAMLSPHPRPLPGFVARAAVRKLQRNAWVVQRSVSSMTFGKDLMDFRLGEVTRPTLIVWGASDGLIPLSAGEAMHRGIPDSSLLIVSDCGHLAPAECSRPILRGTLQFLKANPPPPPGEQTVPGP